MPSEHAQNKIDWEQRRYELVKASMQGLSANPYLFPKEISNVDIAKLSVIQADTIIRQLIESEEQNESDN